MAHEPGATPKPDMAGHPGRQVGREVYGPNNLPPGFEGDEDGPSDDSWIHKAYWDQAGPNPDYIGKPGGS